MWVDTAIETVVTPVQVNALAAALHQAYANNFPVALMSSWELERTRITWFPDDPNQVVFGEHQETVAGSVVGTNFTPANVAVVLSWQSNVYWRGGKPRTYLCGIPQTDVADSQRLTQAAQTSFSNRATNFRSEINAFTNGDWSRVTHGFVSFRTKKEERPNPLFFASTGSTVGARLDSQRRRLGREVL